MTGNSGLPSPLITGIKGRCPRCGEGHLFKGYLSIADTCDVCGLDLSFADTADGPAVLVMFPVGTLVVAFWLIADALWHWPALVHLAVWFPMTIVLSMLFLRPFKGVMTNQQYVSGAREGGDPGDRVG